MAGKYVSNEKPTNNFLIVFTCIAIIALIIVCVLCVKIVPQYKYDKNYNQALSYLENQNCDDALLYFNMLPHFNSDDTNTFFTKYVASLCANNRYSEAYSVLAGNLINKKASALIEDSIISDMELLVQYREAEYFAEIENYTDAYYQFRQLSDYQDSSQRASELLENRKIDFYNDAIASLECKTSASIEKAFAIFQLIPDYEESTKYINMIQFMKDMRGTYKKTGILDNKATYVIDYYQITRYEGDSKMVSSMHIIESQQYGFCYVTDEPIQLIQMFMYDTNVYRLGAYWRYSNNGYSTDFERLSYISDSTEQILKPDIGMTTDEVEKSTWGKPKKINKTTYSWGTTEQWVYDNYRYVYFRNGKVSSIQE